MDAIDSHILQTCSELEWFVLQRSFFQPTLTTLDDLSLEDNIEFLVRCLWSIAPASKESLPYWKLSPNIFERFQMASILADLLKEHNVRGDFGYQTLLYGRTVELRQVFIAVIEKLPKYSAAQDIEQSAISDILVSVRNSFDSSSTWVPEFCRRLCMRREGRLWVPPDVEPDIFFLSSSRKSLWQALACGDSRSAAANVIRSSELASIVFPPCSKPPLHAKPRTLRTSQLHANSEFLTLAKFPADELSKKETRISEILDAVADKHKNLAEVESEIAMCRTKIASVIEYLGPKSYDVIAFLMDPEMCKKILAYLEGSEDRMEKLEKEFRLSREELACDLKRLKNQQSHPQGSLNSLEKFEKIRCVTNRNDLVAEKMKKHLESTKKRDVDRALIIRRIMEMTASIQKQNEEINKFIVGSHYVIVVFRVFVDTLAVQRELKWLTQTLHRTFNIIEEALFKEVEDQKGERAYKLFGKLHLSCMASVEAIERNGALARQNEELLDLVEVEKQNRYDDQLNRIQADLEVIVNENKRLDDLLAKNSG